MTSVEVLAAKRMIEGLPDDVLSVHVSAHLGIHLSGAAIKLEARECAAAAALAAAEKAEAEAAELAAYGGIAGAEAGWNALRQHNPNIDRSTGARDITCFADLPHKKKLECAAFAFGVLNPGAKLGSPVPVEPYQFKVGDKVRITGPRVRANGESTEYTESISETGVVQDAATSVSAMSVGVSGDNLVFAYLDPASLTLMPEPAEPRKWLFAEDVPIGVKFTNAPNTFSDYWIRTSDSTYTWTNGGYTGARGGWNDRNVNDYAPFKEVIA